MFTNEDILVLAKAGFTAEQISALNSVQPEAAPAEPAEPASAAPAEPAPAPEDPEPAPAEPEAPKQSATINDILAGISALNKNMQKAMMQNTAQSGVAQAPDAEGILAEIINPSKYHKEV